MSENQKLQEIFNELQDEVLNPELIQDNMLHFKLNDILYRVRMPNQKELAQANEARNKKFIVMVQEESSLTQKQLVAVLKKNQDVDIEKMDKDIRNLEVKTTDVYLSLARCKDKEEKKIAKFVAEIKQIKKDRMNIVLDRCGFLAPCIENQAHEEYYKVLTAVCTDVCDLPDDGTIGEWSKLWKSYDDFLGDNSKLAGVAIGRLTELMMNI